MVLGMVREESESYFAKLCGEKDQSIVSICFFCWIQIPTIILMLYNYNVYYDTVLFINCFKSTLIQRDPGAVEALCSASPSHSSQVMLAVSSSS